LLGKLGPAASAALPALTVRLKSTTDETERQIVLVALEQMGPAAREAVPTLVACLDCEGAKGKTQAVRMSSKKSAEQVLAGRVLKKLQGCEGRSGIRD